MSNIPIFTLKNISYHYQKTKVLNDISLSIFPNNVYGIIGPNGSGKTTLLKLILKVLDIQQGTITYNQHTKIGVVLDSVGMFPDFSAIKNLKISALVKNETFNDIDCLLQQFELWEYRNKPIKTFSYGMKQKLAIAASLIGNPNILVFDEITNGLDPLAIIQIRDIIKNLAKSGKTIIIASHILTEIEQICSKIILLNKGEIIIDSDIEDIKQTYGSVENVFLHKLKQIAL
jgi:ABC-type multidrug transport system ATPase subunit